MAVVFQPAVAQGDVIGADKGGSLGVGVTRMVRVGVGGDDEHRDALETRRVLDADLHTADVESLVVDPRTFGDDRLVVGLERVGGKARRGSEVADLLRRELDRLEFPGGGPRPPWLKYPRTD